jgi:hypothetical protein
MHVTATDAKDVHDICTTCTGANSVLMNRSSPESFALEVVHRVAQSGTPGMASSGRGVRMREPKRPLAD